MIPKKIHYIWVGGNEMPDFIKKCIKSWEKYCPDYEIIRWDETNLDIHKYKYAFDAYQNKKWAFFSDVHRFDILKTHGGIYLDVDVELFKGLDEFLDCDFFSAFEDDKYVNPGLVMGATPNNKVCEEIVSKYEKLTFDKNKLITVCEISTKFFIDKYNLAPNGKLQHLGDNISIFSPDYFCPKNYKTGEIVKTDNTVSIHHYYASWVAKPSLLTKIKGFIKTVIKKIIGKKNVEKIRAKRNKKNGL